MRKRKTRQTTLNGRKYSGYNGHKIKHKAKQVFSAKACSCYKATPPRAKPAPDNLTYINRDVYIAMCKNQ